MIGHVFNLELAERTVKRYVCSACWGHLTQKHADNGNLIECHSCKEETPGFVTKAFAERRREESIGEKMDTTKMLREVGGIENPHAGKSTKQLLSEMGF